MTIKSKTLEGCADSHWTRRERWLGEQAAKLGLTLVRVLSPGPYGSSYPPERGTYRLYNNDTDELLVHSLEDLDELDAEIVMYEMCRKDKP
jgi:hypothetical protein